MQILGFQICAIKGSNQQIQQGYGTSMCGIFQYKKQGHS
jgi:hypothetical protein